MKTPLRFQVTEYDCGITSVINAISYMIEREDIDPGLINMIIFNSHVSQSCFNSKGISTFSMKYITNLLNSYFKIANIKIVCKILKDKKLNIENEECLKCLKGNGTIIARVWQDCEHYALITKIDKEYVYLFDPYYLDNKEYNDDDCVDIIYDKPLEYNRRVKIERLNSGTKKDFALVKGKNKQIILMCKN